MKKRDQYPRESQLIRFLILRGPSNSKQICNELGISQPTFSLLAAKLKDRILSVGKGRATVYVATRQVRDLQSKIPVFQISPSGNCDQIGDLQAYESRGYVFFEKNGSPKIYPGIPYFLSDCRPQGFLGRSFARRNPELSLPDRLIDWSEDDVIHAIARRSEDALGDLIIGQESFERYQDQRFKLKSPISGKARIKEYTKVAQEAMAGTGGGSSAAGEQPKFLTAVQERDLVKHVLVKFSPNVREPLGRRWADLLHSEAIALLLLQEAGILASKTQIYEGNNRVFLEVERFDRIGPDGRVGIISLAALDDEWFGKRDHWISAASRLLERQSIHEKDASTIRFLASFSSLIANTDTHFGNISFFWDFRSERIELVPAYDILPMLYAPVDAQIVKREFKVSPPKAEALSEWKIAAPLARLFWEKVAKNSEISSEFKKIAQSNLKLLNSANI